MSSRNRSRWFLLAGMVALLGCGPGDDTAQAQGESGGAAGGGGTAGSGGRGGAAGSGGSSAKGGTTGTGGKATGGTASSGGSGGGAGGGSGGSGGQSTGSGGRAGSGGQSSGTGGDRPDGGSGGTVIDGGGVGVDGGFGGGAGSGGNPGSGGGGAAGGCGTPTPAQAPTGVTPLRAIDGFVTKNGSQLTLCGEPFTVLGSNLYYLQSYSVYESGNLRTVAEGLDDSVRMSLPVARMWAFYDGSAGSDTAVIQTAPGQFSEPALVGLDTAIAEAKKRGIRVILTLTNYWEGYGGLPQYAKWAGAANADAFYTNATMKGYFKDYATMLSERTNTVTKVAYKDEPAILAWEIANELRCPSCPDASPVTSTIDELSKLLKSLFPNHLIGDGGEGMDDHEASWGTFTNSYPVSGWERTSFTNMVELEALDMVSYHYYPIDWGLEESGAESDGKLWIEGHHALAEAAGKVAYWGEFGFERGASDAARAPIYDDWLSVFFGPPSDGTIALFWQLVPQSRGADDGFACILGRDPKTVEVFDKYAEPRAPR